MYVYILYLLLKSRMYAHTHVHEWYFTVIFVRHFLMSLPIWIGEYITGLDKKLRYVNVH